MWFASIDASALETGGYHVIGSIEADSEAEALKGAEWVINSMASGKLTLIRSRPEADTYKNFDSKKVTYRGYVRFTVFDQPGEWQMSEYAVVPLPIGFS
jgi:hypothetical protein